MGDTSGPVISQPTLSVGQLADASTSSTTLGSASPRKRGPLRLRPVDRADMSWSEHSGATRELASILTFELTALEELVPGTALDAEHDDGQEDGGTDSPTGSARVYPLHAAGTSSDAGSDAS